MKMLENCFNEIVSEENLWSAWIIYRQGKRKNQAVREFEKRLEENLICLRKNLINGTYKHGGYFQFTVFDPKRRIISAPTVCDHLVHQAVYNILYPFFNKKFSPFSFSCRLYKGTHRAIGLFEKYLRRESKSWSRDIWILHGDVLKCFDSINHSILLNFLQTQIKCEHTTRLLKEIIDSYHIENKKGFGIPLGNLTSQIFINIYLDFLDIFIKQKLKIKKYLRYADDFLIIADDEQKCRDYLKEIRDFLRVFLRLDVPDDHKEIRRLSSGLEVLGQRFLFGYHKCRRKTFCRSRRIFLNKLDLWRAEKISSNQLNSTWQSLKGMLKYGHNFDKINNLLFYAHH